MFVNGDKEAVDAILDHRDIMAWLRRPTPIAETSRAVQREARACFGGAKNHMIIMPDADMDRPSRAGRGRLRLGRRALHWRSRSPCLSAKDRRHPDRKAHPARREPQDRPLTSGDATSGHLSPPRTSRK